MSDDERVTDERLAEMLAEAERLDGEWRQPVAGTVIRYPDRYSDRASALRELQELRRVQAAELPDWLLLLMYGCWSEARWAAGFMSPSPGMVAEFREWLAEQPTTPHVYEDYEIEMLEEYRRQEAEAQP